PNRIAILNGKAPEALGTFLGMKYWTTLFGVPVIMPGSGNYTSSVIPIILIVWFGSIIEKKVKKIMPAELKSFGVPFVVLIVATAVGLIVIGPIAGIITDLIAAGAKFIFDVAPVVAGALIGGFWQILVVFGLHWALVPFKVINIASQGFDQMVTPYFAVSFAQLAALTAVVIKTKDKQTKSLGIPAIISAIAGVTEPAIYGITLPRKKPFIYSCIGGAIGGAIISAAKAYSYISGGLGVFGIPGFIMTPEYAERYGVQQNMNGVVWALLAVAVAMIFTFVITMLFYKESETGSFTGKTKATENNSELSEVQSDVFVVSPMEGTVMELSEVPDEAFASASLGKGCAILPKIGEVKAPCDGVVSVLPDTYHAVAVTTPSGADVLIHIGMNTVELKGKYFTPMVKEGQSVKKGDLLIKFDIDSIVKAGYKITTPVIVSNSDDFASVVAEKKSKSEVTFGEHLLTASK
nr:glucose PTS transporter subunit IIA [Treponema sp.]